MRMTLTCGTMPSPATLITRPRAKPQISFAVAALAEKFRSRGKERLDPELQLDETRLRDQRQQRLEVLLDSRLPEEIDAAAQVHRAEAFQHGDRPIRILKEDVIGEGDGLHGLSLPRGR